MRSQILLAGGQVFFLGDLPFSPHLTIGSAQNADGMPLRVNVHVSLSSLITYNEHTKIRYVQPNLDLCCLNMVQTGFVITRLISIKPI